MALTAKQRKALAQLPKKQRANAAAKFAVDNRGGGMNDAAALRGIKQGVASSVPRPFGGMSSTTYHACHHDAFHMAHLPLPRAVGPYTIVRTTQVVQFNQKLELFGPVFDRANGKWSDICSIGFNDASQTIGNAGNIALNKFSSITGNSSWNGAQVVPAAFSVQLMNPNALQTTSGIVYIGRVRTTYKPSEDLSTRVDALANELISYNNPRLCSAAKLAFRGVQIDAVPMNMSELANFTAISEPSFTQYGANSPNPYGFAPIFIWNPQPITLQALVCCEWRVRFDPSNPAQATHVHHPPAPESVWAQAQHAAEALGNGVTDIADRVAETGQAVYNAMGTMYGVAKGAKALRGLAGAESMLALM